MEEEREELVIAEEFDKASTILELSKLMRDG